MTTIYIAENTGTGAQFQVVRKDAMGATAYVPKAELDKVKAENARLQADAQAAVALVVDRIRAVLDDWWLTSPSPSESPGSLMHFFADPDGLAAVEALRKERDSFRAVLEGAEYGNVDNIANNDVKTSRAPGQVVKQLTLNCYADRDRLTADLAAARAQIEALADALEELKQWADAYPTKVFPEPDLARAAAILSQGGMSLDVISASNMRHVLTRVAQITRAALAALPAKEGE